MEIFKFEIILIIQYMSENDARFSIHVYQFGI